MMQIIWTIIYATVVLGLSAYGLHRFWMIFAYLKHRHREVRPQGAFAELPIVTVQLPIYNEVYVAERLLRSVAAIDYPKNRLEIQVLDDSTDETCALVESVVKELAGNGIDIQHLRRGSRHGFKAGALQYGLERAKGEIVAVFDADFLPPAHILKDTVQYFTDVSVGMIQTRWGHANRYYNMLTRVQSLLLDGHLLIEQTARNRSGRFFNFNGTAGLWRKSCIIGAGGWEHDTLTEDLDLSYRAQLAGWKFIFLPSVITPAELPVDMNSFKAQQHRWAKGAIQTCKKLLPRLLRSPLPWKVKLEGAFHLTSNFAYLLLAILALLTRPASHEAVPGSLNLLSSLDLLIFFLASLSIVAFYMVVLIEIGAKWWEGFFYIPALISVGIGLSINNARAVLEAVFNHQSDFARTPKYGITAAVQTWHDKQYRSIRNLMPVLELGMAFYYAYFIWLAFDRQLWSWMPFLLLFLAGFGYVSILSIFQRPIFFKWLAPKGILGGE